MRYTNIPKPATATITTTNKVATTHAVGIGAEPSGEAFDSGANLASQTSLFLLPTTVKPPSSVAITELAVPKTSETSFELEKYHCRSP